MRFFLFLSVLYAFSVWYNTVYSATKAGVELHCSFRRPGTIIYTRQQMYVVELFGNFTNAAVLTPNGPATVSFDEIYLAGGDFSRVEIYERGAKVGIIELPLTQSNLVNDVYVNWTITASYSVRPILTFYRANQTTYNTMVVEEYQNTFGNDSFFNYLDVTLTTQSSNCQVTNMFYVLVFAIYGFLVLIMIVIACLTLIECYKSNFFLRWVKKALWWFSADWYSQIDFGNEMTGEPTEYQAGDRCISMEKERSGTGTDPRSFPSGDSTSFLSGDSTSFLSGNPTSFDPCSISMEKERSGTGTDPRSSPSGDSTSFLSGDPTSFDPCSGVDSFNVKGKYVSIGKKEVHYLDTNKGVPPKPYSMGEPQKNDLRIYLREIMGDPKLVCVNENQKHHYKIVDVLENLSAGFRLCRRKTKGHFIAL
jgi:hypothetical protein